MRSSMQAVIGTMGLIAGLGLEMRIIIDGMLIRISAGASALIQEICAG